MVVPMLTFQRNHPTARQIRLVADQNDGALGNIVGRPQCLDDALRIDETLAIRRRVDDAVAVRIVAGQAVLRLSHRTHHTHTQLIQNTIRKRPNRTVRHRLIPLTDISVDG